MTEQLDLSFHDVGGSKWTFEDEPVRKWAVNHCKGRVLNACAGQTSLRYDGEVKRNDIDPDAPANTHLDVHELPAEYGTDSFDTIVFDPPWSGFQSDDKYQGGDVNWTRELKEGFNPNIGSVQSLISIALAAIGVFEIVIEGAFAAPTLVINILGGGQLVETVVSVMFAPMYVLSTLEIISIALGTETV